MLHLCSSFAAPISDSPHGSLFDGLWTILIGKALTEIDRFKRDGLRRHLAKDAGLMRAHSAD